MAANTPTHQQRTKSLAFRLVRLGVYLFGAFTTGWFFFGFFGLLIGLLYFFLHRNVAWKRHGLVLAWTAGISIVFLTLIAFNNVAGAPSYSTTYFAMSIGPGILAGYTIIYTIWQRRLKRGAMLPKKIARLSQIWKYLPKYGKTALLIGVTLTPVGLWWSVSIDWGVAFDNAPHLLWVHAPTTVGVGEVFDVTVEAWDAYERLSAVYDGRVNFTLQSYNRTTFLSLSLVSTILPSDYTFTGQTFSSDIAYEIKDGRDNGMHIFTARIDTPGIHYLLVTDSVTGYTFWSNPIIVDSFSLADPRIYWGDIHSHSALSDGSGTPEHHFYYARYVSGLDYAALTDHGETLQFIPGALDTLEQAANAADVPNEFVALQGIEWTQAKTGHYTCIFSGNQLIKNPPISFFTLPRPADLWNTLDAFTATVNCRALAIPHHTTKEEYIQDWTYTNPKYVKFSEVVSVHGEFLFEQRDPLNYVGCGDPPEVYTPGSCVMDAFKMGYHFAVMGGSDEHDGHPGHSIGHTQAFIGHQDPMTIWVNRMDLPYPSGLTAIWADNLTREGIFSSLESQQMYGTSDYGRPYVDFLINGTRVGGNSMLKLASLNDVRQISIVLAQDGAPAANKRPNAAKVPSTSNPNWGAKVEILKNGALLNTTRVSMPIANVTFLDAAAVTGTSYDIANCVLRDGQYYINSFSDNPIDPSTLTTGGADFYVIRIVSDNGRMAYAGPIWVAV